MKRLSIFFVTLLFTLSFSACSHKLKNEEESYDYENYEDYPEADAYSNENIENYKATRTVYTDLIHTKLELTPVWETSYLNGVATLTAKPHFFPSDSLILDAKGMTINSVTMNGKILQYDYKKDVLKITLDRTYTRNETYTIAINYVSKPNERQVSGGNAVTSDKGLYFINPKNEKGGYMPQIWTQGETESNSVWFPTIDSPNMKSTQETYITVDNKYKTLSNGKLVSSTKNNNGTRTDYWKQEKPHSSYLFMIAVGEFEVVEDSYTKKDGTKIPVNYYVEPEWKEQARAIFGKTPKMISYFSNLLGVEYPWDKYSQIVVRDYVSGAMENTGAVVFGDYCYKSSQELIDDHDESTIAHELFHHWFGDLVTAESWSNLPLNESFANFSQYLWDEHEYGKDVAQYNKDEDLEGYFRSGVLRAPIWFYYNHPDDMFDAVSYNKGGAILQQLRAYLGDDAFFAGLNLYLTKNAYKTAEMHNLRMAFEEVTGEDLNWYFNQWFYEKKEDPNVDLSLFYNYGKTKFSIAINQQQGGGQYVIPMTILYVDDAGKHTKSFKTDRVWDTVSFDIKGNLQTVIIDPEKSLLGTYNSNFPAEISSKQFDYATNYRAKKEAIQKQLENSLDSAFIFKALKDPFYGTQLAVLDYIRYTDLEKNNIEKIINIARLKELIKNSSSFKVREVSLDLYCNAPNVTKEDKMNLLNELITVEKSNTVLAKILDEYLAIAPELADVKIDEFILKHPSSEVDFVIAEYYIQNSIPDKIEFFKEMYHKASIREKWNALLYYGYYAPAGGIKGVDDFFNEVEAVYGQTGQYGTYVLRRVIDLRDMLVDEEGKLGKEKGEEAKVELKEIQEIRVKMDSFIEKNPREDDMLLHDY
jgi:aminopeptidase N